MRNVIWIVTALCACGSTGTGDDDTIVDAGGSGSDGSTVGDGSIDSAPVSYAPCDTCCDPIAQDCGASQACYTTSGSTTACDSAGTQPAYASCSINTNCVAGTMCYFGSCRPYCVTDAACTGSAQQHCQLSPAPPGRNAYGICF